MKTKIVLTLTVRKEWFCKILDGTKDEEYREIKPYWVQRLYQYEGCGKIDIDFAEEITTWIKDGMNENTGWRDLSFFPYTHVLFINGYGKERPRIEKEIESISVGKPGNGMCPDKWLETDFFIIKFKQTDESK